MADVAEEQELHELAIEASVMCVSLQLPHLDARWWLEWFKKSPDYREQKPETKLGAPDGH